MIVNVLVPSTAQPSGGVLGIVEFANGLARRGHEVHLVHLPFVGQRLGSLDDLAWCPLEPTLVHHLVEDDDLSELPSAPASLCFDARTPPAGVALTFLQAHRILPPEIDDQIFATGGPLLCTSTWLRRVAIEHGVPPERAFHLPYGIRHEKYRLTRPIEGRPPRVAMLYNSHPVKDTHTGIAALEQAKAEVPELEAVLFSTTGTVEPLPDWIEYVGSPPQQTLVDEIYNGARAFLSPAIVEGFGLAAVESMACGCALVTTANGGSDDYARDGETALVTPPRDVDAMAAAIVALATDDRLAADLARAGGAEARRFDWDRSAELLEGILLDAADGTGVEQGVGAS